MVYKDKSKETKKLMSRFKGDKRRVFLVLNERLPLQFFGSEDKWAFLK